MLSPDLKCIDFIVTSIEEEAINGNSLQRICCTHWYRLVGYKTQCLRICLWNPNCLIVALLNINQKPLKPGQQAYSRGLVATDCRMFGAERGSVDLCLVQIWFSRIVSSKSANGCQVSSGICTQSCQRRSNRCFSIGGVAAQTSRQIATLVSSQRWSP